MGKTDLVYHLNCEDREPFRISRAGRVVPPFPWESFFSLQVFRLQESQLLDNAAVLHVCGNERHTQHQAQPGFLTVITLETENELTNSPSDLPTSTKDPMSRWSEYRKGHQRQKDCAEAERMILSR